MRIPLNVFVSHPLQPLELCCVWLMLATPSGLLAGPIQDAIDAAPSGSVVAVPEGIFYENLIVDKDLTLQGAGRDLSVLDGQRLRNIVFITTNHTVALRDLSFQNFSFTRRGFGDPNARPGAISSDGSLNMSNCLVNGWVGAGGAGGFQFGGGVNSSGPLTLVNCIVTHQKDEFGGGGAIRCVASLFMSGCVVTNNELSDATWGAALYSSAATVITNCVFARNYPRGGGTLVFNGGTNVVRIDRTQVRDNGGEREGNGLPGIVNYGVLEMSDSLVSGHFSEQDAAFVNYGTAALKNCTVSDNTSKDQLIATCAGIRNQGTLRLDSVTIVSNQVFNLAGSADRAGGGGLRNQTPGVLHLRNCLVGQNHIYNSHGAIAYPGQDILGTVISEGYNFISNTNDCLLGLP